jgi:hypothetical protein
MSRISRQTGNFNETPPFGEKEGKICAIFPEEPSLFYVKSWLRRMRQDVKL